MSTSGGPIPDSYWVVPGRLLAGGYPGARTEVVARTRLALFRQASIDFFVDLTEEGEHSLRPYAAIVAEGGAVEHRRFPIRDGGCPTRDEMRTILETIDLAVADGKTVYVHCYAGVGRTGTVAGCYLVRHGMTPSDALQDLQRRRAGTPSAHRRSPETDEQTEFVLAWPN